MKKEIRWPEADCDATVSISVTKESPESATIEGWVARDACDALYLHQSKPELSSGIGFWYDGYDKRSLPEDIFPEITFKNSPRKVRITITPIEE